MKGLTNAERDLLKTIMDAPPSACTGLPEGRPAPRWSSDQHQAAMSLVASGRAVIVPCSANCGRNHLQVTPDGLMAWRLDQVKPPSL